MDVGLNAAVARVRKQVKSRVRVGFRFRVTGQTHVKSIAVI